ncbi:unnamed protein product [Miscanthus lutarioriparius]|uniref:Uncharacterized protein n=1 Tax=Miscanthus lutarioriparius TaxID=422564 RepID=A0A811QSC0_9POAL|nr:unnamed protein product [Miscanthus lutarioriparius]
MAQRAMCLLRRSIVFTAPPAQRALSTTATPAAEGAAVAEEAKGEEEEEESVRCGAVPARVGHWIQGCQDHLARCILPDHQDQPIQGDTVP